MPSPSNIPGWRRWFNPQSLSTQPENGAARLARRIVVSILGFSVILVGLVMIITPGPAIVVIPAGLAILALEFAWARRWLRRLKAYMKLYKNRRRGGGKIPRQHHPPTL
jgi:uncharacterized protein (TIGR02611 family)